jgi:hypothetical protein
MTCGWARYVFLRRYPHAEAMWFLRGLFACGRPGSG